MKRVTLCLLALLALSFPPVQASAAPKWKCQQWHTMLRKHGLPIEVFDRIMWRESRCIPHAVSRVNGDGSRDVGLLQINNTWRTLTAKTCKRPYSQVMKSLTDPSCNLKVARVLWANGKGASNWRATSGK